MNRELAAPPGIRPGSVWTLSLLFLSLSQVAPASAQTIQGQLLHRESGLPIEGALVLLLNEAGSELDGFLTNDAGRFRVRTPGPGAYTLRAIRIGYETVVSGPIQLSGSEITGIRLLTAEQPIPLRELRVEGTQQCRSRPEEGLPVQQVWEEIQKALTIQDWTQRTGPYLYEVDTYERLMDPETLEVQSENRRSIPVVSQIPMESLPAQELVETGFVREIRRDSHEFFAPDAGALLSDAFLDTHCFWLTRDESTPGSLGLAMEPMPGRSTPDIEGTLWLNPETMELDFLEFRYTWVPRGIGKELSGGRVYFEPLPNGTWIVRRWYIRMPSLSPGSWILSGLKLTGIKEMGAEVSSITPVGG